MNGTMSQNLRLALKYNINSLKGVIPLLLRSDSVHLLQYDLYFILVCSCACVPALMQTMLHQLLSECIISNTFSQLALHIAPHSLLLFLSGTKMALLIM